MEIQELIKLLLVNIENYMNTFTFVHSTATTSYCIIGV